MSLDTKLNSLNMPPSLFRKNSMLRQIRTIGSDRDSFYIIVVSIGYEKGERSPTTEMQSKEP